MLRAHLRHGLLLRKPCPSLAATRQHPLGAVQNSYAVTLPVVIVVWIGCLARRWRDNARTCAALAPLPMHPWHCEMSPDHPEAFATVSRRRPMQPGARHV